MIRLELNLWAIYLKNGLKFFKLQSQFNISVFPITETIICNYKLPVFLIAGDGGLRIVVVCSSVIPYILLMT